MCIRVRRKGVRAGLITTSGFRDVLEIGRQTRPKLYDLRVTREEPLVPRDRRVEVIERLDERGGVMTPLDAESVTRAVQAMVDRGVRSVAVCLLFSFCLLYTSPSPRDPTSLRMPSST